MNTSDLAVIFAAVIMAMVFGFFVRHILIAAMSNVAVAKEAAQYLEGGSLNISYSEDKFIHTRVMRTPKARQNT